MKSFTRDVSTLTYTAVVRQYITKVAQESRLFFFITFLTSYPSKSQPRFRTICARRCPRFEEADRRVRSLWRTVGIETEIIQRAPAQRIGVWVLREGWRAPGSDRSRSHVTNGRKWGSCCAGPASQKGPPIYSDQIANSPPPGASK